LNQRARFISYTITVWSSELTGKTRFYVVRNSTKLAACSHDV